ncbi:hypothetical protein MTR_1g012670 [Medicago truncatula]|uniref:Uncharacterized protein n=1 Tax=Medicago truncatula TaxID=3880 RepID=G7I722_MEDTR|nr:hypothetical protein MTR_1g012670 [Medicago truncatula]
MHRGIKNRVGDTLVKPISQLYIKLSVTNKNQGNSGTKIDSVKVTNRFPSLCEKKMLRLLCRPILQTCWT